MIDLVTQTAWTAAEYLTAAPSRAEVYVLCGAAFVTLTRHDARIAVLNRRLTRFLSVMSGVVQTEVRRVEPSLGSAAAALVAMPVAVERTYGPADLTNLEPILAQAGMIAAVSPIEEPAPFVPAPEPALQGDLQTLQVQPEPVELAAACEIEASACEMAALPQHLPPSSTESLSAGAIDAEIPPSLPDTRENTVLPTGVESPAPATLVQAKAEVADHELFEPVWAALGAGREPGPETVSPAALSQAVHQSAQEPIAELARDGEAAADLDDSLSEPLGFTPPSAEEDRYAEAYRASLAARIEHEQRMQKLLMERTQALAEKTEPVAPTEAPVRDAPRRRNVALPWSWSTSMPLAFEGGLVAGV